MRYSGFQVIKQALNGHKGWKPAWRDSQPQPHYDIIIIGGGGHGLATAHYLAKEFGGKRIKQTIKGDRIERFAMPSDPRQGQKVVDHALHALGAINRIMDEFICGFVKLILVSPRNQLCIA